MIVLPVTIVAIFVILYAMFTSVKWALLILTNVAMAPLGGLLALLVTHTNLSVSSGVGFLALFEYRYKPHYHGGIHQPTSGPGLHD
jgi:cobalt-zinc-cadmium resistance protein CzcA